jgi:LysM repeat protein
MRAWTSRLSGLVLPLIAVVNLGAAAILARQEQGLVVGVSTPVAPTSTSQVAYATEQVEPTGTLPPAGGEISPTIVAGATTVPSTAQAGVIFVPTVQVATPTVIAVVWPTTGQAPAPTVRSTARPLPTNTPRPRCVKPANWYKYIVQAGDTLFSIAGRAATTVDALKIANCLTSDLIYANQVLLVPRPIYPPTSVPLPSKTPTRWHTATPAPTATGLPTEMPTSTPLSMPTDTPVPLPTDTPVPPTDTPPPPPTSTPVPPPTDTPPPLPTDTPPPPPTDIPLPTLEPTP